MPFSTKSEDPYIRIVGRLTPLLAVLASSPDPSVHLRHPFAFRLRHAWLEDIQVPYRR